MIAVACWLALAVIVLLFGKLCDSKVLTSIGAIMVLMLAAISEVS